MESIALNRMGIMQMDWWIIVGLILGLLVSVEIGFYLGRKVSAWHNSGSGHLGTIQGSMLGILGLLLGFSYSIAHNHSSKRQELIIDEANAIGTAAQYADLLMPKVRAQMLSALYDYTSLDIAYFESDSGEKTTAIKKEMNVALDKLWAGTIASVRDDMPAATQILPVISNVRDLHTKRMAAGRQHLSPVVLGLLILVSMLAIATVGLGCGISGKRQLLLPFMLALMVASVLYVVIDIDHPRTGLLRIDQSSLVEQAQAITEQLKR